MFSKFYNDSISFVIFYSLVILIFDFDTAVKILAIMLITAFIRFLMNGKNEL